MKDVWSGDPDTDRFWDKERREVAALPEVPTLGQSAEEHNARWAALMSYRQGEAYRVAVFFEGAHAGKVAVQVIRQVQKMGRGHLLPRHV